MAGDHRFILSVQAVIRQLRRQSLVRHVILCRNDKPRCVLIDAVDYAGSPLTADTGEAVPAMVHQRVYKCAVRVPRSRVDHHAAGLVDNDNVRILIDDVERDILRFKRNVLRFRKEQLDHVPGISAVILLQRPAVKQDSPGVQTFLDLAAGILRQNTGKESVDTFSALLDCYLYYALVHYLNSLSISSRSKSVLLFAGAAGCAGFGWAGALCLTGC